MLAKTELKMGKTPRTVKRGVNSQKKNEVGLHWLRISIVRQYLSKVRAYLDFYFGESSQDGYGLWSYDSRFYWPNGASLNYDGAVQRSDSVHNGKFTVEIPGQALDGIAQTDLHLFLLSLRQFSPTCTRCDVFFDDYNRTITPSGMHRIVKSQDYSCFRKSQIKQLYDRKRLIQDEVDFGKRGPNGSGQYLRIYDKVLESKGKKNCIRFEVEFTKERSHKVFDKLSQAISVDAFATLCGSLVGGSVKFVHRNGDKNISRLDVYEFWQEILDLLGSVVIRIPTKETDIAGKYKYIYRQVSPTLALLRETFVDDTDFFNWLNDVIGEGELRMSQAQINLARANKSNIRYDDGKVF
ncbi:unnamed protein product, partial [marine sediment metagenome]